MASPGRPSIFTEELATRICERLAAGETLRAICRDEDMPAEATVRNWAIDRDNPFFAQYARAREIGYSGWADHLLEIADDPLTDPARSRLMVDTRKWLLSKALPKVYGDKLAHVGGSAEDDPLRVITEIQRVIVRPDH